MGYQKHSPLTRGVGELSDVGKQTLCAWHVELPAGQHEVRLRVDFPKNYTAQCHVNKLITSSVSDCLARSILRLNAPDHRMTFVSLPRYSEVLRAGRGDKRIR